VKEGNDYLEIEKGDLRTEVGRGSHNTHAQQQILVASNTAVKQIVIADGVTTHTLNAGTISMQAPAMVEITAPMVIIKGNLWVQGGIVAGTSPPRPV
jgi:hypothetical protein